MQGPEAERSRYAPLAGAAIAFVGGVWLAWTAVSWASGDCPCGDSGPRSWLWVPLLLVAAGCAVAAAALIARFVRRGGNDA